VYIGSSITSTPHGPHMTLQVPSSDAAACEVDMFRSANRRGGARLAKSTTTRTRLCECTKYRDALTASNAVDNCDTSSRTWMASRGCVSTVLSTKTSTFTPATGRATLPLQTHSIKNGMLAPVCASVYQASPQHQVGGASSVANARTKTHWAQRHAPRVWAIPRHAAEARSAYKTVRSADSTKGLCSRRRTAVFRASRVSLAL